jgi:exopolysaccharide biosynthesis polyprenyl glycosylphosphotransferase
MANLVAAGGLPSPARRSPGIAARGTLSDRHKPVWIVPDEVPAVVPRRARQTQPPWMRGYRWMLLLTDFAAGLIGVALALLTRFGAQVGVGYVLFGAVLPAAWVGVMAFSHGYDSRSFGRGVEESRCVLRAGVSLTGAIAIVSYATHSEIARGFVVIAMPAIVLFGLGLRRFPRRQLIMARRSGQCMRRVLVVGRNGQAAAISRHLRHRPDDGYAVVATCVPTEDLHDETSGETAESDIMAAVLAHHVDVVAIAADPELAGQSLRRLTWALEQHGVDLIVSPGIVEVAGPRIAIRPVAGLSLLHLERPSVSRGPYLLKSVFDRSAALLLVLILLPVLAVTSIAVRLTSNGPAIFRQRRVGISGKEFLMLKLRSMYTDAEERLSDVQADNQGNEILFKLKNDPRVTKLGRQLRRFSLDELPQLFNVLRGDMSLVGPRPPLPQEVASYEGDDSRRMLMKPGITGLWQVSGRSDLSWEETIRLDLHYIDNWSMTFDLLILWKTLRAVVRSEGAY